MSTVRNTLNSVRYDWLGVRIGGPGASMRGQWPVLIAAVLVVFGCFFAIGLLFSGGGKPTEGSSVAPAAHAAIPGELHGGSPIAGEVPSAIAQPPQPRASTATTRTEAVGANASSQSLAGEAGTETGSALQAEAGPTRQAAPKKTSTPSRAGSGAARGKSSGGGSRTRSRSGGSFDSSE